MQYRATARLVLTRDSSEKKLHFWGQTVCKYHCNVQFVLSRGGTSIRLPRFIIFTEKKLKKIDRNVIIFNHFHPCCKLLYQLAAPRKCHFGWEIVLFFVLFFSFFLVLFCFVMHCYVVLFNVLCFLVLKAQSLNFILNHFFYLLTFLSYWRKKQV